MNGGIQFDPVPYDEASKIVADRPVVDQNVFRQMIPEIRARAFLISGIEDLKVAQNVRDLIAELPQGGDWDSLKNQIEQKLMGPGGIPWMDEEAAAKRAEILMRHHGFQAYAAANYQGMSEQRDAFPYWQYLSMGDDRVRDSHAKLHGLILPADHPFWDDHFPPWDWGCRCQVVPISQAEHDRTVQEGRVAGKMALTGKIDEDKPIKSKGWVLPTTGEKSLATSSRLDEGIGSTVNVASPKQRATDQTSARDAYQWNPGDLRIPVSELHDRYGKDQVSKDAFSAFYRNMQTATYLGRGETPRNVWDWALSADVDRAAKLLLRKAKTVKIGGLSVEHALLVDHRTGQVLEWTAGSKRNPRQVDPNAMLKRALEKKQRVVLMHNHFGGGIPSPEDVVAALQNRKVVLLNAVAGPNGKLQTFRVVQSVPDPLLDYHAALVHNFSERYGIGRESLETWKMMFDNLRKKGILQYEFQR